MWDIEMFQTLIWAARWKSETAFPVHPVTITEISRVHQFQRFLLECKIKDEAIKSTSTTKQGFLGNMERRQAISTWNNQYVNYKLKCYNPDSTCD